MAGKFLLPSPWQSQIISLPGDLNLALFGGRGAGRTTCAQFISTGHCEQYQDNAHVLFLRQTLRSLREVEDAFHLMLYNIYKNRLRVNRQDHIFTIPGGATLEFSPLADADDMAKLQGRSFSMIVADEFGNFTPQQTEYVGQLYANLRAGKVSEGGAPTRQILLANPGGRNHQMIVSKFINKMKPYTPCRLEDGLLWMWCPANYDQNPHLPDNYDEALMASSGRDQELFKAWTQGAWNIARGAMFQDCIDDQLHKIVDADLPWMPGTGRPKPPGIFGFVACDWGQSSPSVAFACYKLLQSYGPYPKGSLLIVDEVHSATDETYAHGANWSPGRLAEEIDEMVVRTGVYKMGVMDDAHGLVKDDTLIKNFQFYGYNFERPAKNRRSGWAAIRELLTNAKLRNGKPGLWIHARCEGFWATVPVVPRDSRHPEDVDTKATDHWADTARYAAVYEVREVVYNSPSQTTAKYGVAAPVAPKA